MSCPHGNPIGGCDICSEIDAAHAAGLKCAPNGFVLMPELATEEMVNAVIRAYPILHPSDVAEIYGLFGGERHER